jgi:hypothetical protein
MESYIQQPRGEEGAFSLSVLYNSHGEEVKATQDGDLILLGNLFATQWDCLDGKMSNAALSAGMVKRDLG